MTPRSVRDISAVDLRRLVAAGVRLDTTPDGRLTINAGGLVLSYVSRRNRRRALAHIMKKVRPEACDDKLYSKEERRIAYAMRQEGYRLREIGDAIGRSERSVQKHFATHRAREIVPVPAAPPPVRWSAAEDRTIAESSLAEAIERLPHRSKKAISHRRKLILGRLAVPRWTEEEERILMAATTLAEASRLLPRRSMKAIENHRSRLLRGLGSPLTRALVRVKRHSGFIRAKWLRGEIERAAAVMLVDRGGRLSPGEAVRRAYTAHFGPRNVSLDEPAGEGRTLLDTIASGDIHA